MFKGVSRMAKKKKKVSPAVAAIRKEIAQYEKLKRAAPKGIAGATERKRHGTRVKVLRYAANLLIDFFGD
jgi:hypothetical protein